MDPDYELFVAIVEEGSLAGAAARLNVSRPSVSKRLARLEDRLGARLLHRTTRKVLTTRDGQGFFEEIRPIIAAAREAEARLTSRRGKLTGDLHVRTVNSLGRRLLGPMIASFVQEHPQMRLHVTVEDRPIDLLTSRIDAEVTFAPSAWQGAIVERLAPDRRVLVASPDYIERNGYPLHPDELAGHDILASPTSLPWRLKGPDGVFTYHGKTIVVTNSSELPGVWAMSGLGIALRPVWAMMEELRNGRLIRVLPDYESDAFWSISVATHADRLRSAGLEAFVAHLKRSFAGLDEEVDRQLAEIALVYRR